MRITKDQLVAKLHQLDQRLINIWLSDDLEFSDDEIWEMFVVLLETRVEILKTLRDAGVQMSKEICMPDWLERLVEKKQNLRLRDIKNLAQEVKRRKQVKSFETVSAAGREEDAEL